MNMICLLCIKQFFIMSRLNRIGNMHNLGELFKRQKVLGKSQKEAASFLNIDHRSVSRHIKQKSLGYDILTKYAEYLEVPIFDLVAPKIRRQINGYLQHNKVHMYGNNEERPVLEGVFAASWWWEKKDTIITIDQNDKDGFHFNTITFFTEWLSPILMKERTSALYQNPITKEYIAGYIERVDKDTFSCINFYEHRKWDKLKLKKYARFICSYTLSDLPIKIGI